MNKTDFYVLELIMDLVYDTASAQVVQVVKIGCKSRNHSHRNWLGFSNQLPQLLKIHTI